MGKFMTRVNNKYHVFIFWLRWVCTRAALIYVLLFFISSSLIDYNKISFGLKLRVLNMMMPTHPKYLTEFIEPGLGGDVDMLVKYNQFYENTVKTLPERIDAYNMLGFTLYHLNKKEEAINAYLKAVEKDPNYFWAYYNLGVIYYQLGDLNKAVFYLENAVKKNPAYAVKFIKNSNVVFSNILDTYENKDEEIMNRLRIGFRNAYALTAIVYYREKKFDLMVEPLRQGIKLNMHDKSIFYFLGGVAAYDQSDYQKAILLFQKGLQLNSKHILSYNYLVKCFRAVNNSDEAQKYALIEKQLISQFGQPLPEDQKILLKMF